MFLKNNLKNILDLRKISQRELSKNTGIKEATISRYVKGDRRINIVNAIKIAKFLDLEVDTIWEL